jgi:hypothetical protein
MRSAGGTGLAALAFALMWGAGTAAHHSYGATYDLAKEMTVEGKLVQFVYRNPHSFVTVQAPDDKGALQRWAVEWSGTGQLGGQGITRETLRTGDQVVIVGRPSRVAGEMRLLMVSLKRPLDGFSWGVKGEKVD